MRVRLLDKTAPHGERPINASLCRSSPEWGQSTLLTQLAHRDRPDRLDGSPAVQSQEPQELPVKTHPTIHLPAARTSDRSEAASLRIPLALAMGTMLSSLAFVAPPPFFPDMSRDLGVSVPVLGQIMTAMLLIGALLAVVIGPLADRHGLRRLPTVGAFAAAGCLFGFGLAPSYALLLIAAVFGGLANATLPGLSLAVARTTLSGATRQRAIGWTSAGGAITAVVAVPLLTVASSMAGWRIAFIAGGIAATGFVWFLATSIPPDVPQRAPTAGTQVLLAAYSPLVRHRPTLRLYGITVLRSICWFGLVGYFGAFLSDELGLSVSWIGLAYMMGGGGYVTGSLIAGKVLARLPARLVIGVTNITIAIAVGLTFYLVQGPAGAIFMLFVSGIAGSLSFVGTVTLLSLETPGGAGTTMSLSGALTNLGAAGGGAIGGSLLATGGYEALALGLPLFAVSTVLLLGSSGTSAPATASCIPT